MNKRRYISILIIIIMMQWPGAFLHAEGSDITGEWIGSHSDGFNKVFWDKLIIEQKNNKLKASLLIRIILTEAESAAILAGKSISSPYAEKAGRLIMQEMEVTVRNSTLVLKPVLWTTIYGSETAEPEPVIFELKITEDKRLVGFSTIMDGPWVFGTDNSKNHNLAGFSANANSKSSVVFEKKGVLNYIPAFSLEKGKTIMIECLDAPGIAYSCYIPTGYNPERAVPVIVNDSPGSNAYPFAVSAAEELCWISAGLPEGYNGIGFVVIRDIYKRFKIADRGLYLAGFSGGAQSNAARSPYYRGKLGGIIDIDIIGAYCSASLGPDLEVPVCFLLANKDARKDYWAKHLLRDLAVLFRWMTCLVYNADHSWGPVALHDNAVKWLAKIRREPGFLTSP